jgi:ferritin-like metal-binding protein YciE
VSNPRDLLLQQLAQLLWVERMLAFEVLPSLQKEVKSEGLAQTLAEHLQQTRQHVSRVGQAFRTLEAEPSSGRNQALAALASQHDELAESIVEPHLKDFFHAAAAIHSEHLELAGYEAAITLARTLGAAEAADLLEQNRKEEEQALKLLRGHAERLAQQPSA